MKICLVGSSRFADLYREYNARLTLAGHVVYSIAMLSSQATNHDLTADQKETLDLVHLRKIQESEAVLIVTDETKYIGESTRREIKWAQMNDKAILTEEDLKYWERPIRPAESFLEASEYL